MAALSTERLNQAIPTLCKTVDVVLESPLKEVPVSLIQKACAVFDIINSHMPTPTILDQSLPHTEVTQCSNVKQLKCILPLMVKIVSG